MTFDLAEMAITTADTKYKTLLIASFLVSDCSDKTANNLKAFKHPICWHDNHLLSNRLLLFCNNIILFLLKREYLFYVKKFTFRFFSEFLRIKPSLRSIIDIYSGIKNV